MMDMAAWMVTIGGVVAALWVVWYFWLHDPDET